MQFLVRGVEPHVVKKLDELWRTTGFRSRNEYVNAILENHTAAGELRDLEQKYNQLVKSNLEILRENTEVFHKVIQLLQERSEDPFE